MQLDAHPSGRHFLQIPGPSPVPDRILRAMSLPTIDHRGPEFGQLGLKVLGDMQKIFQTRHPVIIYPASGTGAWEAAFRWTYVDLSCVNVDPANQLSNSAGPPPAPGYGVYNAPTLALNWWWNRFTRVQFNYIHAMPDVRGRGTLPFDIFGTRFQIEF